MPMIIRKMLHALYLRIMKAVVYFSPSLRHTAFAGSGSSRQLCEHIIRTGVRKVLVVTDKPLRELGGVLTAEHDEERGRITLEISDALEPAEIGRHLHARDLGLRGLTRRDPTLEEVFMTLTKGLVQ